MALTAKQIKTLRSVIFNVQQLESRCHLAELSEFSQILNKAKNELGWTFAERLPRADQDGVEK